MSYATESDLDTVFGAAEITQLADRDGNGTRDTGVVAAALAYADAVIDGHLAGRYALPLATVPPLLLYAACDLARYRLYAQQPTPQAQTAYDQAIGWLTKIGAGALDLTLPATGEVADDLPVLMKGDIPVFARSAVGDY